MSLIKPEWEPQLHKYITGIVQNNKHKMIAINGTEDHLHLFIGFHTTQSVADLMRFVKGESSEWINSQKFVKGHFSWQEGYAAFSYARSQLDRVFEYIINQKKHHAKMTFMQEYVALLEKFGVQYDKRYVFKEIE